MVKLVHKTIFSKMGDKGRDGSKFQKIGDIIYEWPLILLYFSTFQCQWRMFGSNCPIFGEITMFEKIKVLA